MTRLVGFLHERRGGFVRVSVRTAGGCCTTSAGALHQVIQFEKPSIGDYPLNFVRIRDIFKRVALDDYDVGKLAWLYASGIEVQRFSRVHGGRFERLKWSHSSQYVRFQFAMEIKGVR